MSANSKKSPRIVFDLFNRAMTYGDKVHCAIGNIGISGRIVDICDYKVVNKLHPYLDTFVLFVEDEFMNVYPLIGKKCALMVCDPKNHDLPGRENDYPEVEKIRLFVEKDLPLLMEEEWEEEKAEFFARLSARKAQSQQKTPDTSCSEQNPDTQGRKQ